LKITIISGSYRNRCLQGSWTSCTRF